MSNERYIFCNACNTLSVHMRCTGDTVGWICIQCNVGLEEWS